MKIKFIPVNFTNLHDCNIIAKWFNDPNINYLISPNFSQGKLSYITPESISQMNLHNKYIKHSFFIIYNNIIVGEVNIIENPDFLLKKDINSCWLGITIGEKEYQGLGIGKRAMTFIEKYAKNLGFIRIELGVFSFNSKAINFYKKMGYVQIGIIPHFTFYNGKWHDDIRFEKYL